MSLVFTCSTAASKWSSSLTKDSFLEFGPVKEALNQPKVPGALCHMGRQGWKCAVFNMASSLCPLCSWTSPR